MPIFSIQDAWVQLFEDDNFEDTRATVRYPQAPDGIKDLSVLRTDNGDRGFEDEADSALWQLPAGWACHLYEDRDHDGDRSLVLIGTGEVARIAKFGRHGFSDKASSLSWESELKDIERAYVVLHEDRGYGGRRLGVDHARFRDGIANLGDVRTDDGEKGFDNKPSSLRWRIPAGWACVLHEHPHFSGRSVTLKGRGFTYRWADVDNVVFDSPAGVTQIGPFNDKISSLQWVRQS